MSQSRADVERDSVVEHVLEVLRSLTQDVDVDPITLQTCLGDTGLDSVCVAYLIGEIQQYYGLKDALYRALVKANLPILTIRVYQLVDCVCEALVQNPAESEG